MINYGAFSDSVRIRGKLSEMLNREILIVLSLVLLSRSPISCSKLPNVWVRQTEVCNMTPPGLAQSFNTSCNQLLKDATTCAQAWNAFSGAFAGRDPAAVVNR
jgi:hypothetical protein